MAGSRGQPSARRPDRHRFHFVAGARPRISECAHHRLRCAGEACRAHRRPARFPGANGLCRRRPPPHAGRRVDARLRTNSVRGKKRHPDELPAPRRRAGRARQQALQRHSAPGGRCEAVRRPRNRTARAWLLRAGRSAAATTAKSMLCAR